MSTINVTNLAGPSNTGTAATLSSINGGPISGARNRIINGDMRIDQRNGGASVTNVNGNVYTVDRWSILGYQASKFTAQQNAGSITPAAGFTNYLGCTSSSAYTVGSAEYFALRQAIEGFNCADLDWGKATAKAITLSFWVRSSLAGTFGGSLSNNAVDRSYAFSYTISAANTWEYKTVTVAGDTSGTWLTNNSVGIYLFFSLGSGSSFSTTANTWAAGQYTAPTGATSVVGTNGATFYITGVQLEPGTVATPFERRSYGQELALAMRYYQAIPDETLVILTSQYASWLFPVPMRAVPTMTIVGNTGSGASFYPQSHGFYQITANNSPAGVGYTASAEL